MTTDVKTGSYKSEALGREQAFAWIESPEPTEPASLLILLHGMTGGYMDWLNNTRVEDYVRDHSVVVVFPDGANGFYTNGLNGDHREDDIANDLVGYLTATFNLKPPGRSWAIGGLSMGGYGALKLALRHPNLFSTAFSHSGALAITHNPLPDPIFGLPDKDAAFRRGEDIIWLAEQALTRFPIERPRLHIDCGLDDHLLEPNRQVHGHLAFLGYPHTYAESPGHHTWPYWNRALRTILPTILTEIGADRIPDS